MILIISENDQILAADKDFLQDNSLEDLKLSFSSMELFQLQSESGNNFEYNYCGEDFFVTKKFVTFDAYNATIFEFSKEQQSQNNTQVSSEIKKPNLSTFDINNDNDSVLSNIDIQENKDTNSIVLEKSKPEKKQINNEKEDINDLNINFVDEEENSPLTLDFGFKKEKVKKESFSLDFGEDNETSNEELTLNLDSNNSPEPELSLDLGNSNNEELTLNLDSNNSPEPELSLDLGNSNNEELTLNLDSNNSPEPELSLDLGNSNNEELTLNLDSNNSPEPELSITKEDLDNELLNASKDLGIDYDTIQTFFKEFEGQLKEEKEILLNAISSKDYETIHKSAHKLKGVALNLRLNKFGSLFETIDNLAKDKKEIATISNTTNSIYNLLDSLHQTHPKENLGEEFDGMLELFISFLERIKSYNSYGIRKELKNTYKIIPLEDLKNIDEIQDNKLVEYIEHIQERIKDRLS